MTAWICATCAVEHEESPNPPASCAICTDERQYVPKSGQRWTSLTELAAAGHRTRTGEVEPDLYGIVVEPSVGIGQRTLLVRTPHGNLLWEANGFLDDAAVAAVRDLGGVAAIAASHPHMYGSQLEWSRAFGDAPVYVCAADREWLRRTGPAVRTWDDSAEILPGLTLVRCGGHFPGSCVLHWPAGAAGRGVLLTGDTVPATPDGRWVSFMRSYPNNIPLSAATVRRLAGRLEPYAFDRTYGSFGASVDADARAVVRRSAHRYAAWVGGEHDADT